MPDDALMARILADAERIRAAGASAALSAAPRPGRPDRPGWAMAAIRAIGGWPALAGLAAATLAGVWIGAAPPDGLAGAAQFVLGGADDAYLIDIDPAAVFMPTQGAS